MYVSMELNHVHATCVEMQAFLLKKALTLESN